MSLCTRWMLVAVWRQSTMCFFKFFYSLSVEGKPVFFEKVTMWDSFFILCSILPNLHGYFVVIPVLWLVSEAFWSYSHSQSSKLVLSSSKTARWEWLTYVHIFFKHRSNERKINSFRQHLRHNLPCDITQLCHGYLSVTSSLATREDWGPHRIN